VEAGSTFTVAWEGPNNDGDYIYLAEAGSRDNQQVGYVRTDRGNPTELTAPGNPGAYELRYILGSGSRVIARAPLVVTAASASFAGAPASASAGSTIRFTWEGPGNQGDYLAIAEAGSRDNQYSSYEAVRRPGEIEMQAPRDPGDYELRYVLRSDTVVIARQPITITP
jgi:Ca-activated chloride channel family protein